MSRLRFHHHPLAPVAMYPLMIVACLLALLSPAGAHATHLQATPTSEPMPSFPRSMTCDLPAMVLPAEAFPVEGLASERGRLYGPEQEAANVAPVLEMEPDALLARLEEIGWMARYVGDVALPSEEDPAFYAVAGASYITEFEDEAGAEEGFALLEAETGPEWVDVEAEVIGDEAELTRAGGEDPQTGVAYVSLDYTFRTGNLVAGVSLTWFEDAPTEHVRPEAMVESAERLLERIDTVIDGGAPELSGKLLRLESTDAVAVQHPREAYDYLDGDAIVRYGETEEMTQPFEAFWESSGVTAAYAGWGYYLPADTGDDLASATYVGSHIYGLSTRLDARDFVDAATEEFLQNAPDSGYVDVQELQNLPEIDGPIRGVSYTYVFADGSEVTGARLWLQVDTYVVNLEADSPDGIAPDVLYGLIDPQVECIESERFCQPIDAPIGLVE